MIWLLDYYLSPFNLDLAAGLLFVDAPLNLDLATGLLFVDAPLNLDLADGLLFADVPLNLDLVFIGNMAFLRFCSKIDKCTSGEMQCYNFQISASRKSINLFLGLLERTKIVLCYRL